MATLKRPLLAPDSGASSRVPANEGPAPDAADTAAYAIWRCHRSARLRREREARGDPRWLLTPCPRLTPAMRFLLLTGKPPAARLVGWVSLEQSDDLWHVAWAHHAAAVTSEAAAAGFLPWAATHTRPTGPKVEAWRAAFEAQNGY